MTKFREYINNIWMEPDESDEEDKKDELSQAPQQNYQDDSVHEQLQLTDSKPFEGSLGAAPTADFAKGGIIQQDSP